MEEKEETKCKNVIRYKINTEQTYPIYSQQFEERTFYYVNLTKKNQDGTELKFRRTVRFVGCKPPQNGDIIRIKSAFEDDYFSKYDRFNAVMVLVIEDYDIIYGTTINDALEKYQSNLDSDDMPF